MDFFIGTNKLRNSNGRFIAQGQTIMQVEQGQQQGELFLTLELYNPTGTSVAKLIRNQWEGDNPDRFELAIEPGHVIVRDTALKNIVIQMKVDDGQTVNISQAKFYLPNGTVSEITPEWWRMGNKFELKDVDVDLEGGAIEMQE